jgi:hypothetical protein
VLSHLAARRVLWALVLLSIVLTVPLSWMFEPDAAPIVTVVAASILVLLLLAGVLFVFPSYFVVRDLGDDRRGSMSPADFAKAKNDVRTALLQAIQSGAIVLLLVGAYFTWQENQATKEKNLAEEFSQSVENLTGEKGPGVQLAGIYALEKIAVSSDRDREPVIDILSNLIRDEAPWPPPEYSQYKAGITLKELPSLRERSIEAQTAVTVLGRLAPGGSNVIQLSRVDLRKADLSTLKFKRIDLTGSNLQGANLNNTILKQATLDKVNLQGAETNDQTEFPAGFDRNAAGVS